MQQNERQDDSQLKKKKDKISKYPIQAFQFWKDDSSVSAQKVAGQYSIVYIPKVHGRTDNCWGV